MKHFAFAYSKLINEILHTYLISTWFYKHQIYEVPGICTALLVTYDNQDEDEFEVFTDTDWDRFLKRMSIVKSDWKNFSLQIMTQLAKQPQKTMLGWEGRTIYFIKGGTYPEFWTNEKAREDALVLLSGAYRGWGVVVEEEAIRANELIPVGQEHYLAYENFVRVVINFLFIQHLGEAKPQVRTDPENESLEIRDLICQNRSDSGFWKGLKEKYSCSEIVFEAKNKNEITKDDLQQLYCYLKPALGLWGFIVCRNKQSNKVNAYNRTLFKNFIQERGVLVLSNDDLRRMIRIKKYGRDPSEYLHDKMSEFLRSI